MSRYEAPEILRSQETYTATTKDQGNKVDGRFQHPAIGVHLPILPHDGGRGKVFDSISYHISTGVYEKTFYQMHNLPRTP
jgi:hypothetical protein